MSNIRRQILLNAFKLFDMIIMVVAFGAATAPIVRASRSVAFAEFFAMRVKVGNFVFVSFCCRHAFLMLRDGCLAARLSWLTASRPRATRLFSWVPEPYSFASR